MDIFDKRTASVLTTILLFVAAGAFIYAASRVLLVFILAIFFAYLLEPLVSRFQLWTRISRGSRALAIVEVYLIIGIALTTVFIMIGSRIFEEGRTLAKSLPGQFERLTSGQIALQIGSTHGWSNSTQLWVQQFLASHSGAILSGLGSAGARAARAAQNTVWIVLIPILAIFFLKDGRVFSQGLLGMFELRKQKQFLTEIFDDLNEMLAHFIRSQLILSGLSIVTYMVVLALLRVPFALALGALAGVMEFIPVVGPVLGAAAILGVAFLSNYPHLLVLVVFLALWRLVQDYVTTPRLMGDKLELHPLTIIFAILVGAEIGGVIGVYLSIPVAAALRIVWKRWQGVYAESGIRAA